MGGKRKVEHILRTIFISRGSSAIACNVKIFHLLLHNSQELKTVVLFETWNLLQGFWKATYYILEESLLDTGLHVLFNGMKDEIGRPLDHWPPGNSWTLLQTNKQTNKQYGSLIEISQLWMFNYKCLIEVFCRYLPLFSTMSGKWNANP